MKCEDLLGEKTLVWQKLISIECNSGETWAGEKQDGGYRTMEKYLAGA